MTWDISYFDLPAIPDTINEWTALIPLVIHLASSQDERIFLGEACLHGRIVIPLFPKFGDLKFVSDVLSSGSRIFDATGLKGSDSARVWDCSWGSIFECANAAARSLVTDLAFQKAHPPISYDTAPSFGPDNANVGIAKFARILSYTKSYGSSLEGHRRYQTLNIVHLKQQSSVNAQIRRKLARESLMITVSQYIFLLLFTALCCICGAFGTATVTIMSCLNTIVCALAPSSRPHGYLQNNESYQNACMLTAPHENVSTWTLYVGDRSVVDWLLNKNMLAIQPIPRSWIVQYFQVVHYIHLLAMTYVAAQKAWDGVFLLSLLVLTEFAKWRFATNDAARTWLKHEGISCEAVTVKITGRTPMLGGIQIYHDRKLNQNMPQRTMRWMSDIIAPGSRFDEWSDALQRVANGEEPDLASASGVRADLTNFDLQWVRNNTVWSKDAADRIEKALQSIHDGQKSSKKSG